MRMANKGFFKPLLPGFHSHLVLPLFPFFYICLCLSDKPTKRWFLCCNCMLLQTIPVAFFLKYIEGTNEHHTAKLRSDASMITWEVKIEDGKKLTEGWKEFALAHDLRIGDILIFRQEKDMAFHVTLLGPSGCEIQYESCSEEENNLGKIPKKMNSKREAESSSSLDPSCFKTNIWPSSLRYDTLNLPKSFVRANGLETSCGGEIVLMNEKGRPWTLVLKQKLSGTTYIRRGWRRFCIANRLKTGGVYTFKLIQSGRTPVLLLSSKESESESESEERNFEKIQRKKAESSSLDPSCFVANISRATLRYDTLGLPMKFSRENGLEARCGEIVLMNEKGRSWKLNLKRKISCGTMYITQGWRSFCSANGLRAGSSSTFKLIKRGGTLALRLSSKETEEEEEEDCSLKAIEVESLSTEPESDEESSQDDEKIKKHRSTWKASSSQSQNRFVTLTLRPFNLEKYSLFLPLRFTRWHGINEETKMRLLDKNGVKWSTDLRSEKTNIDKIRLVGGWQEFFKANCVKTGESIMLKLIWEGDKRCVLKFFSKV
ncbi:B3 domain-containing protein REM14-like isoform X1 [Brassica rapa]|nr:B3 domain-containing protein REM14-like isoform X1 [Brassica rapa]